MRMIMSTTALAILLGGSAAEAGWECDLSPLTLLTGEPNITITANIRYRGTITIDGRRYWRFAWCSQDRRCRDILVGRDKE